MLKNFLKLVTLLCSFSIIFTMVCGTASVSAGTAIAISSKADLDNIRQNLSGEYYLTCDIVFTEEDFEKDGAFYNNGAGFVPIGTSKKPFTGSFDGKGYSIVGVKTKVSGKMYKIDHTAYGAATIADDGWTGDYIIGNTAKTSPAVGLFGFNAGEIKNLSIVDFDMNAVSENNSASYVGGVAGYNIGLISNCAAKGTVRGDVNSYCGLISGYLNNGQISDCYSVGNDASYGKVGSILGTLKFGLVKNVYNLAIGYNRAPIYSQLNTTGAVIEGCYYISAVDISTGFGTRIAPENAKTPASFEGFDFENVWRIDEYQSPVLAALTAPEKTLVISGDTDGNGEVNLADVALIAQYVAEWDVVIQLDAANTTRDFDDVGNNNITLNDVSLLAQYVAEWDSAKLF